jgi:hypothetical protein
VAQQLVRNVAVVVPRSVVVPRGEVVPVALARLRVDASFREAGIDHDHVRRLVGLSGHWPPILVHQADGLVIDGLHRVAAARLLGLDRIDASLFNGGPDEALIEFVRRNVYHGLPLTLRDRKRAAGRVLSAHPEWSDRRIAELCALSPKTVGRLRPALPDCPSEEVPQLAAGTRLGRDNRSRPVNSAPVRARVVKAIEEQPDASLRSIAAAVGVSPETVRLVRLNMNRPPKTETVVETIEQTDATSEPGTAVKPADKVRDFVAWFDRTSVSEDDCLNLAGMVPLDRVHEVVAEARRRSEAWNQFARSLAETRTVPWSS